MSVPVNARNKGKLEVFSKSLALCKYTLEITSNEKVFIPRYQAPLTSRIADAAIAIHADAWKANNIVVSSRETLEERQALQAASIAACYELLSLVDIAKPIFHLETRRVIYWTKLVLEARSLLRAWKDADAERYRKYKSGM